MTGFPCTEASSPRRPCAREADNGKDTGIAINRRVFFYLMLFSLTVFSLRFKF